MARMRIIVVSTLLALVFGALMFNLSTPAEAQSNLLTDPGFEDTNMKVVATSQGEGTTFSVNVAWNGWYTETPRTASWQNRIPNGTGRNNVGMGFVRTGNRSMELSRGGATFTAAVYQTVTVPENANLVGSAYVVMNISGDNAASANSTARVGIDPTGGTNPLSSSVIWSSSVTNALASNGFRQMTVNATAIGTRATLFLYATQTVPTAGNGVFWDDTSLTVGGTGGTAPGQTPAGPTNTPVPTAPPSVPFVVAQAAQADGSIIHTVQAQDTLSSIAVAYGVAADEIRELNPQIGQGRFLTIGQQLTIRVANPLQGGGEGPGVPLVMPTEVANAAPTQAAQTGGVGLPAPQQQAGGNQQQGEQPQATQPQDTQPQQQAIAQADIRLYTVYNFTNDLAATRNFYSNVIGLTESASDDTSLTYDVGGVNYVFLLTDAEIPVISDWSRQPDYPGGVIDAASVVIHVVPAEWNALIGRIQATGTEIYGGGIVSLANGMNALYMRDPQGRMVAMYSEQ